MNDRKFRYISHKATGTHVCSDCHTIVMPGETYYTMHPVLEAGEIERYGTFSIVCTDCKDAAESGKVNHGKL